MRVTSFDDYQGMLRVIGRCAKTYVPRTAEELIDRAVARDMFQYAAVEDAELHMERQAEITIGGNG